MLKENETQPSPEEVRNFERMFNLALKIAKEAVELVGIPKFSPDDHQFTNQRWSVYYHTVEKDLILNIEFNPLMTTGVLNISLAFVVLEVLREVEDLLSNQTAREFFDVEDSQLESVIYERTLEITLSYIYHFPIVIYHSFYQALNESIINQIKKFVEPDLREHWANSEVPKDFSLVPEDNLSNIVELFPDADLEMLRYLEATEREFSTYRKAAFSDRKVWLTPQALMKLPDEYEQLRSEYTIAKKEYKSERQAFFKINRRAELEDWEEHWSEYSDENFPNLFLTQEIPNYAPSALSYRHLAEKYNFSPGYMEKLVINAREQSKNKERQNKERQNKKSVFGAMFKNYS
jgi:hypothetical protein